MELKTREPVWPVLVADGLDVTLYRSPSELDREIEGWYVDEAYAAYDTEGRSVELVRAPEIRNRRLVPDQRIERVAARLAETEPEHADELKELLEDWCDATDTARDDAASLHDLLLIVAPRITIDR